MVLRCSVHLDSETLVYKSGDSISGFIVLSTSWSDKLYGITVRLASKVLVDWDASRLFNPYRSSRNEDVSFHSHCQIIMNREGEQSCLSNLVSKRTIMITRGVVHRYPFLLKLPRDLPPTFSGSYGYISYKLVVFIRKPFREMYIGASKSIKISPILDLNDQSCQLQLPVHEERKYRFGPETGDNAGKKISMRIHLQHIAFVPDQPIHFNVGVDNRSNLSLRGVRIYFNGNTYFQMEQSWKVDRQTLLSLNGPPIQAQSREIWSHSFPCPEVTPSGLGSGICQSIDLQYFLHFELDISDSVQLSVGFKVVVGTLPYTLRGSRHSIASFESGSNNGSRRDYNLEPERRCRAQTAPPAYDFQMRNRALDLRRIETPPPSYEEALSMNLSRIHLCPFYYPTLPQPQPSTLS